MARACCIGANCAVSKTQIRAKGIGVALHEALLLAQQTTPSSQIEHGPDRSEAAPRRERVPTDRSAWLGSMPQASSCRCGCKGEANLFLLGEAPILYVRRACLQCGSRLLSLQARRQCFRLVLRTTDQVLAGGSQRGQLHCVRCISVVYILHPREACCAPGRPTGGFIVGIEAVMPQPASVEQSVHP